MKKGFGLLELLLVVVVLGILMTWMLPQYLRTMQKEHQMQHSALDQARELQKALNTRNQQQQFQIDNLDRALQNVPRKTGATRKVVKK